ncbi:kinesin-like protein KIF19 [Chroicocephalus ridibundus]|uniref:kinesin-like protein KIF19 n=1 Tax=Chroicocephalus ridibundus TaxID=1192867 RepID=UPI002FDEC8E9
MPLPSGEAPSEDTNAPGDSEEQQLVVALRIRPMSAAELAEGARPIAHLMDEQVVVLQDPMEDPDDILRASCSREKSYVFDVAFDSSATQETVYHATTQGLVAGVISGHNATVFAYGPTGCGKTYTMLGTDGEPGIYARTLGELFQAIEDASGDTEYEVSMSYLEIYNEMIRDLLNPSLGCLQLREDAGGTIQVAGITEVSAISAEEVLQALARGNMQRTQEPTAANRTSSRSHAVLQVTVRQRRRGRGLRRGRLFMIDLAGSERAAQTQNRGQRMKEGAHINRSLLALGNCIKALSHQASTKYINYRDSKLTRLLKDSLGGNSHTVMIAHISPASTAFEESRSTLAYAHRAKSIRTTAGLGAQAEPAQLFRQSQQHTRRLDVARRHRSGWEEQREVLALLCRLHHLELEAAEMRSRTLLEGGLQHPPATVAQRFGRHRALCARIIQQQRQLIADHRLSVPRPLEELYETYLQELAGDFGDSGTLKVGQGDRAPPRAQAGHSAPVPAQGTSLPKVPQVTGTESLWDPEQDSVRARSCEHPTLLQDDALPPLRPMGDSTPTPVFKKTPRAQQLGSAAVPTPPPGRGTVALEVSTAMPAAPKPRERREVSSSTKSIVAKAVQCRSGIPESIRLHSPDAWEEWGGPRLWHTSSEVGTCTPRSPGTWLRARKKGHKEPGRRKESLDGRRRSRRSQSFEVTGHGHHARGPSLQQLASPMVPPLPSTMLQSRSEHAVLVGARAASTQGPPKALPRAKPLQTQLPAPPRKGQHPRLGGITGNGASASGKDGWSCWY